MKIVSLTFKNIHSLQGVSTIEFEELPCRNAGLILITGSTGAGKSTILDAIAVALYNQIPRHGSNKGTSLEEIITRGENEATSEVIFWAKGNYYKSTWHLYKAKSKKNEEGKIQPLKMELANLTTNQIICVNTDVPKFIPEITGLDYERFMRSVMLAQGDFAAFLKSKPNDRGSLLEKITGTEIYSNIVEQSKEITKKKRDAAENAKKIKDNLQLLLPTQIQEINNKLLENEPLQKKYEEEIKTLTAQNQFVDQKQTLQSKIKTAEEKIQSLENQKNIHDIDFKKLEQYRKALPISTQLADYENCLAQIDTKNTEQTDHKQRLQQNTQAQKELNAETTELQNNLNKINAQHTQILPLITQAQHLEQQWKIEYNTLDLIKKQKDDTETTLNTSKEKLTKIENDQNECKEKLDNDNKYLLENRNDAELETNYGTLVESLSQITNLKKQIDDLHTENQNKQADIGNLNAAAQELEKEHIAADQKLKNDEEKLASIQAEINATTPLNLINDNINTFQNQVQTLEKQKDISKNYSLRIEAKKNKEQEKQKAFENEEKLRKEIEDLKNQQKLAKGKQELMEQKITFELQKADFETHRQNLKHNEPCPLCGATHHPFAQNNRPTGTHNSLAILQQENEKIKKQILDFQQNIEQKNTVWATEKANFDNINAQITENEIQLNNLQLEFDKLQPTEKITDLNALQLLLSNTQTSLNNEKKAQSDYETLSKSFLSQKETCQQQKDTVNKLQNEQKINKTEYTNLQNQITANTQKITTQLQPQYDNLYTLFCNTAQPFVQKNPDAFNNELTQVIDNKKDKNDLLTIFRQKKDKYSERKNRAEQTQNKIKDNETNIQALKLEIEQLEKKLTTQTGDYQQLTTETENLRHSIEQLTQNFKYPTNLEKEKETWLQNIKAAENNLAQNQKNTELIAQKIKGNNENLENIQKQINKLQEQSTNNETQLLLHLAQHDFTDIEHLKNSFLKPNEAKQIEALKNELDTQLLQCNTTLNNDKDLLQKTENELLKYEPIDNILQKLEELKQKNNEILEENGGLKKQLEQNEKNQKNHSQLFLDHEIINADAENWEELNSILTLRGKNFSQFVQEITLAHVVYNANHYLSKLNPRYKIKQATADDKSLELEIIDTHYANQARSMKSLSGGETFLTCLALALGLSDLVGKNAHIQTLFIDEGFGTLDQNTLNIALNALENLQQDKEKTICLISHVKELQERIPVQIQVNKKNATHSNIKIISNFLSE